MSLAVALLSGVVLGARHSLEADHIAAIATLVDGAERDNAGRIGTAWAIGHALPTVGIGLAFLAVGIGVPDSITVLFEAIAGLVLVVLGVRLLCSLVGVTGHEHDDHDRHTHLSVGSLSFGLTHTHRGSESFLVRIVHGLAGSGTLVVLLVATAPSLGTGVSFLGAFTITSILVMAVLAARWGRVLTTRASRALQAVAGLVSVAIGIALVTTELFAVDRFGHGHDHTHAIDVAVAVLEVVPVAPL